MTSMQWRSLWLLAVALGCGSTTPEEACDKLCDKSEACDGDIVTFGAGGDNCAAGCAEQIEDFEGECEDKFIELAECYDDNSCEDLADLDPQNPCFAEAAQFLAACDLVDFD